MITIMVLIPWIALLVASFYEDVIKNNRYPFKVLCIAMLVQFLVLVGFHVGKAA